MPRRKPSANPTGHLRRRLASTAARLMAEDGIADFALAKRKAARVLGVDEGEALPTNNEIGEELRAYQDLFQDDEQAARLREMRQTALEVMERFAEFHPYLTGAVVDGTAGRFSSIDIDLYADSAKDVEISLLNNNIGFGSREPRQHGAESPETILELDWNDYPVRLAIYPLALERQQRRNPHTGRQHPRISPAQVIELLSAP